MPRRVSDASPRFAPPGRRQDRDTVELTPRLNALIGELYETAIDAPRIQAVLDEMTALAAADNGGFSIVDMVAGEAQFFVFSPAGVVNDAEVLGMFKALEPWRRAVLEREPGRLYLDDEMAMLQELTQSDAYQRWLQVSGNRSRATGYLPLGESRVMFIGFARGAEARHFTREDVRPLELVLPHIARAARINRIVNELTVMHDVAEDRYGQLGVGILLLNTEGRIAYRSRTANRILALETGLVVQSGLLRCNDPDDQSALDTLIERQGRLAGRPGYLGGDSMTVTPPTPGSPRLSILVAPYKNRFEVRTLVATAGRVLILLFDPTYRAPTREQALQQLYGMTETEAELAAALATGQRLEEIAAAKGASKETLRSRLKRIFAKTGTRRQSELLRLLLASPALLEHRPAAPPQQGKTV